MAEENSRRKFLKGAVAATASVGGTAALLKWNSIVRWFSGLSEEKPDQDKAKPKNPKKYLILDSGHGGLETGAKAPLMSNGACSTLADLVGDITGVKTGSLYEDEIAYDVLSRVVTMDRARKDRSDFEVIPIVKDKSSGYTPKKQLVRDTDEYIVGNGEPKKMWKKGYNLTERTNAINKIYKDLIEKENADPDNIYLLSIHVNSEKPNGRGAFTLYPEAKEYGEVAERKSKEFADGLIKTVGKSGVRLHEDASLLGIGEAQKKKFLFYNAEDRDISFALFRETPQLEKKLFLEIGNMKNIRDLADFYKPSYRDNIAGAIMKYMKEISG